MKPGAIRDAAVVVGLVVAGLVAYRAYRAASDAAGAAFDLFGRAGDSIAGAYDAVTGVLSSGVEAVASVPDRIVTAVHGPAVPAGNASVQRRHTTDLPEGSYQAAAMYWSLYPDAVFYD